MVTTQAIAPIYPRTPASLEQSGGLLDPIVDDGYASKSQEASFGDFVDILNPLHHIPVLSTLYRAVSGDEIKPAARAIGSLLYGGPISMVSTGVQLFAQELAGTTPEKMIAEMVGGGETRTAAAPMKPDQLAPDTTKTAARGESVPAFPGNRRVQDAAALKALARDLKGPNQFTPHGYAAGSAGKHAARAERPDQRAAPERRRHANLPPANPTPEWIAEAMQRALLKYRQAARTPGTTGAIATASPVNGAVPIVRR